MPPVFYERRLKLPPNFLWSFLGNPISFFSVTILAGLFSFSLLSPNHRFSGTHALVSTINLFSHKFLVFPPGQVDDNGRSLFRTSTFSLSQSEIKEAVISLRPAVTYLPSAKKPHTQQNPTTTKHPKNTQPHHCTKPPTETIILRKMHFPIISHRRQFTPHRANDQHSSHALEFGDTLFSIFRPPSL